MYFEHPLVSEEAIEERAYQSSIASVAKQVSTLVVLPTGMGKTIIAFMVMAYVKEREPEKKILFLAPTKPLVRQHARDIGVVLKIDEPAVFTGEVRPEKRKELWGKKKTVVATPQVIENDLMAQRIGLDEVGLIIFDEAHRGVGDYSYVFIGERYNQTDGLSLGLTASPGSEIERILSVCENLGFEHVEIRNKYDPDVVNYTNTLEKEWIDVRLPKEQRSIVNKLKKILEKNVKSLQDQGFLEGKSAKRISRKDLIKTRDKIQAELHSSGSSKSHLYNAASVVASAIKVDHAVDQAETQGLDALRKYLEKLKNEADSRGGSKAAKKIMNSSEMQDVRVKLKKLEEEHPKIEKVVEVVEKQIEKKEDSRIIVFTNYRATAQKVNKRLAESEGVRPIRFVGQTDKTGDKGLKQDQQIETINKFEEGKYNVLVATSVGEEGLDIPATDMVVFYEPVPSEIRTIQRRGRTARKRKGKVVILITKSTRDEAYYWSSKNKEKKMHRNLKVLRKKLDGKISVGDPMKNEKDYDVKGVKSKKELKKKAQRMKDEGKEDKSQRTLGDFEESDEGGEEKKEEKEEKEEKLEITVDTREQNSVVVRKLANRDVKISTSQLSTGDYIVSEEVAVERKTVEDFLESLTDGRLFSQVKELSGDYLKPVMILEGEGLFEKRNIDDSAIFGAMASIAADFGMPIVETNDGKETAELLFTLVKRSEGEEKGKSVRKKKSSMSDHDTKRFILEGLPSISGVLADRLLEHFGSVREVFNADVEELQGVKGIGAKTAERIIEVIN